MRREPYHLSLAAMRSPYAWAVVAMAVVWAGPGFWRPVADPDLWWLVWAGRAGLEGALPSTNTLSWVDPDVPWTLHEPLVALTYAALGPERVAWARGAVLSLLAIACIRLARGSAWATLLALLWALPGVSVALSARPMAWGLLLLAATLLAVRWKPWLAALLCGVWANVHGSFPLGLRVVALYAPGGAVPAALATLVNPHGWHLHELVVRYALGSDSLELAQAYVVEWRPLVPRDAASVVQLVALVGAVGVTAWQRRWRETVLAVVGLTLALRHQRFLAVAMVWTLPSIAAWLDARLPRRPLPPCEPLALAVLTAVAVLAPHGRPALGVPQASPELRTWSDLTLGACLGAHGVAPFWDARNDCYRAETLADGVRVALRTEGWGEVLRRHEVEQVVTTDGELTAALEARGWVVVAQDPMVLVAPEPDG